MSRGRITAEVEARVNMLPKEERNNTAKNLLQELK